ncbi:MAG TPA: hypothetical protein VN426_09335 [Syntrophomonadaceae bacterium]|nr:hypothetical protein [Syntrophomonadaceae bacterium]
MKNTKIVVITLIIAFAALGGAYALWYDSLYINETVETGKLNIEWACTGATDSGEDYTGSGYVDHKEKLNPAVYKNIGSSNYLLEDDSEFPPVSGVPDERNTRDSIKFDLKNCYPGYQESVVTLVRNYGDMPVKLQNLQPKEQIPSWLRVQIQDGMTHVVYYDSQPDANTSVVSINGQQVDPGRWLSLVFIQRVLDGAPQNHNNINNPQQIAFGIEGVQWNAYNVNPFNNTITPDK